MNTQNYTVNIRTGVVNITRVDVSQGDTGRTLAFSLYDGLIPFTPPNGSTVTIVGRKPSKLGFSETCTVSGNVATVATTLAMTQEAGKFPVELRIEANGESIGTANFTMYIEPSPHPDGTTDGTHATVDNLQTQIGNLANLATTAKTNLVSAINEAAQSGGVVIDDTLTQTGQAADAAETGRQIGLVKADLEDLDERVETLEEGGSGGSGLTDAVKTALMNLVNHLAWDDDDPTGQTYITALYNALYPPAPPASLTSITAVYTQSGAVCDADSLNDLKSDLVVTAHYSDSTSHAVTDYTLSGTLAVGTSVIAVNYNGKSTTFNVTVTAIPYSFHEGIFTGDSSYTNIEIEVSGGHFHVTNTAGKSRSMFIDEDSFGKSIQSGTMFSLSAGDEYEFKIKNIVFASNQNVNNSFTCTFRNPSDTNVCSITTPYSQTTGGTLPDVSSTGTIETSTDVTCLKLVTNYSCEYEFDFEFWVNGERWI